MVKTTPRLETLAAQLVSFGPYSGLGLDEKEMRKLAKKMVRLATMIREEASAVEYAGMREVLGLLAASRDAKP